MSDSLPTPDAAYPKGKPRADGVKPFPKALRTAGRPTDPNKASVHDGVDYFWCDTHGKWGKHKQSTCKVYLAEQQAAGSGTPVRTPVGDTRQQRAIRAVAATMGQADSEDEADS